MVNQLGERRASMKRFGWVISLAAVCMLVASCGGGSSKTPSSSSSTPASAGKIGGKLVIDNVYGGTWPCQFNPFVAANEGPGITFALVYEPLEFVNILQSNNPPVPMLATSSQWSNQFKMLTFTIRNGIKWSDGQPFTAQDVVYTFNAMKSDKAVDINALWSADGGPLTSVALKGSDQVVLTFKAPSQPYFYFVADLTPIIPQHVWSTLNQSKLHSYGDTQPVGTRPYKVSSCSPQNIKYQRNPNYWQSTSGHPVPAIKEI